MKKFLLLLILNSQFLIHNSFSQAPDWLWSKRIGGINSDYGYSIAIDPASGDVYTTGDFGGTVDFDPGAGTFNLTGGGGFISKLDSSGNFIWAKAIGGSGVSISIDPASGDVYTTGIFLGTTDFDPGAGIFNLTDAGSYDSFISKLDASGNFVWAKSMGGMGQDVGYSIAIDASGNVYTTGGFEGTADFDPGAGVFNLTTRGSSDIFISKLDASGNFIWAKAMGGTDSDIGYSIAIDPSGSGAVYTTGLFYWAADFDPGTGVFNLTTVGMNDIFISKLDASGNFVWAKAMGGSSTDQGISIAIDPAGSGAVYTSGGFDGTSDFDPDSSASFNLTSNGWYDIFLSKLDSSGNFVWAKAMGGTTDDQGYAIAIDPAGSGAVYTSGYFKNTVDFDPGVGVFPLTSAGNADIFITKSDSSGNFVWAKAMGGANDDFGGNTIALNASGNVYITGKFESPSITFGSITLTNAGGNDIFIARLDTTTITGNNEIENFGDGVLVFPNPATSQLQISIKHFAINSIEIYDVLGQKVFSQQQATTPKIIGNNHQISIDVSELNAGIYFLQFQSAGYSENRKFIVTK
jgi:hypothetical protein